MTWRLAFLGPFVLALAQSPDPNLRTEPGSTREAGPGGRREHVLRVARQIIRASRYCTLVTLGPSGEAQARIVDPLEPDASFEVHVATNPRSRKVDEIRKDPRVTLLYFDPAALAYVTVVGRALEVKGAAKTSRYKPEWQGFFSLDRPESYSLYRIVPSRLEVVSPRDGLSGDPTTWHPETVDFK